MGYSIITEGLLSTFSMSQLSNVSAKRKAQPEVGRPAVSAQNHTFAHDTNRMAGNDFTKFLSNNRDLLGSLAKVENYEELLKDKELSSREDIEKILVEAAQRPMSDGLKEKMSEEFLSRHMAMTRMLATDDGTLMKLLEEDEALVDTLMLDATSLLDEGRKEFAELVSSHFEEGTPLSDATKLEEHVAAAFYVIDNEDMMDSLRYITGGVSKSRAFLEQISRPSRESAYENHMVARAAEMVGSGTYSSSFLEDNMELAELVVIGEHVKDMPTMSLYLKDNPDFGLGNIVTDRYNLTNILQNVAHAQAMDLMDGHNPFSSSLLKSELGLSHTLVKNDSFRNAVLSREGDIRAALEDTPNQAFDQEFVTAIANVYQSERDSMPRLAAYVA